MRPNCKLLIEKIRNNLLLFSIFISLVIGFSIGSILKKYDVDSAITVWFKLPGLLFIRCLELLILPVIFIGVVAATSTLSAKNNVRITLICVFFIFVTHLIAVITGHIGSLILKAVSISQTDTFKTDSSFSNHIQKNAYDIVSDILRNIIPKNIIKSATHQEITKLIKDSNGTLVKKKRSIYRWNKFVRYFILCNLNWFSNKRLRHQSDYFSSIFSISKRSGYILP